MHKHRAPDHRQNDHVLENRAPDHRQNDHILENQNDEHVLGSQVWRRNAVLDRRISRRKHVLDISRPPRSGSSSRKRNP